MTAQPTSFQPAPVSQMVPTTLGALHVVTNGTGPETLVLWPSIFTDHHIYDALVAQLGATCRFILIDGPGHGQSAGPITDFSMAQCAAAMAEVMDHFDLSDAVIGGTSWGGMVAAELALSQPQRAKALLLMNTPMHIGAAPPPLSSRMIALGARWMPKSATFQNGVAKSFFSPQVLDANPAYARAFHDMLTQAQPKQLAAAIRSVLLGGTPLEGRLANLGMPVLVIGGKEDAMYPIEAQAEAALSAPNGRFAPVPGKHISVVECPETVAPLIGSFLTSGAAP